MIWFKYEYSYVNDRLLDIYGNVLLQTLDTQTKTYYQYQLETKYRYSGLLYDKLRCLFSYICRNIMYTRQSVAGDTGADLCKYKCRFDTKVMYPMFLNRFLSPFSDSLLKSLYFIDS